MEHSLSQFAEYAEKVARMGKTVLAIDFETTGLNPRGSDRAFVIGYSSWELGDACYYFTGDGRESSVVRLLTSNPATTVAAHNAKFEMAWLRHQWQAEIAGNVWCTEALARIENNSHRKKDGGKGYGLEACAERIGTSKYAPMVEWLGKGKSKKRHCDAPRELVTPYVIQDARISLLLQKYQRDVFREWDKSKHPIAKVVKLEMVTTKNCFEMEDTGFRLNTDYGEQALAYEKKRQDEFKSQFQMLAGVPFVDSAKTLQPVFDAHGIRYLRTEKGNPSFDAKSLALAGDSPVARCVRGYRDSLKRSSSYWENLLGDAFHGVVHPSINQNEAASGRMSITNPAAQTWPDDFEDPTCVFPIRRAIIADDSECFLASLDYAQMELRKAADEAQCHQTIAAILNKTDLHQVVADIAKVPRSLAKNGRFAKQYGAGIKRVAETLGVDYALAERICKGIDEASPGIAEYLRGLIRYMDYAPYGTDWLGRRFFFGKRWGYKFGNYRIQGGCAEILKIAIDDGQKFLVANRKDPRTRLKLPVHDELVLNVAPADRGIVAPFKQLMIDAHRDKISLGMDVSAAYGPNLHDLEDWVA